MQIDLLNYMPNIQWRLFLMKKQTTHAQIYNQKESTDY